MPGYILHENATVMCGHGGEAKPPKVSTKVKVGGNGVALLSATYTVSGCSFPPPPAGAGPCASASFSKGADKVKVEGEAPILDDGQATATPTGVPLNIASTQKKVKAK